MTATLPSTATEAPVEEAGRSEELSTRLLGSAAKKSYDPVVDIDWAAPIPTSSTVCHRNGRRLFGTPLWNSLTHEQRVTLTIHEYCSMSGVGIWFECLLMQLVLRDIARRRPRAAARPMGADRDRRRMPALGHVRADGGDVRRAVLPAAASIQRLGKAFAAKGDGPAAYAAILVAEEILDIFQRDLMKDERVQPLTRATSQIHVVEEARHMRFAREEIARRTPSLSAWQLRKHRTAVAAVAAIVAENLVQPSVYASVGLDPREAGRPPGPTSTTGQAARRLGRAGGLPARGRAHRRPVGTPLEARPAGLRTCAECHVRAARRADHLPGSALGELGGVEADRGRGGEVEALRPAAHRDAHPRVGQRRQLGGHAARLVAEQPQHRARRSRRRR